jgi:xyloglucan-specific exo-beta-1,4-glucanase
MKIQRLRRGLVAAASAGLVAGLAAVAVQLTASPAEAQQADPYTFSNVEIVGGGFVPNIIFNETEPNLIYARTDIGGAYRWNASTSRWVPMLDWVGWSNWGFNGVSSIATDPRDPNRVYVAAGMYTNTWDPNNGAILRSTNRGQTWQVSQLPFKLGGNMPGRGSGERLAVDPNNNAVVYFGAPEGNGLWRSTNAGQTWSQVTSFPNVGNWSQDPNDPNGYLSHRPGVVWVTFDPRTGSAGSTTQTIYAGVADLENTVYRSTNGGSTWTRVANQPTGFLAQKGALDPVGGFLYITTSNNAGPYDGTNGEVWRMDTATGAWTEVTPPNPLGGEPFYGFSGLSLDRRDPGTLMVTGYSSWWPDTMIFRSTDNGATWTPFWTIPSFPTRANRFTMSVTDSPWLTFGANPQPPEQSPKLGWMTQGLAIDPHNSNRMMYGTGATIYGTTNLTALDTGGNVNISVMAEGLEETAVLDLISPPSGAPLVSGLGDIGGFRHTSLTTVPSMMFTQPVFTTTRSLDYAELNPSVMVRAGDFNDADRPNDSHAAFSTDGGANWFQGTEPGGVNSGGTIAAAADGSRFVWAPGDPGIQVHFSVGFGNSWQQSQGVPANARVESDRVNPNKFYAHANGTFYVSTNGGQTFTQTATGLPTTAKFKAVPGREGDIWLAGDTGLFRSTNSGTSFTRVTNVTSGLSVGFGAAAPGASYQAIYLAGTIGGVTGVFRSDNTGSSWVRINDDQHQYGNMGEAITGDPRVYGRVYLGTNGRGVILGTRNSTATVSPPPTTTSPPPSTTSPPPATSSPPPSSPVTGGCSVAYTITGQWGGGFQGEVRVTNNGASAINGWDLRWSFTAGQTISQMWGGRPTQTGANVSVLNETWNAGLAAGGGNTTFGFIASWNGSNPEPSAFTLNGTACTVT